MAQQLRQRSSPTTDPDTIEFRYRQMLTQQTDNNLR